MRCSRSPWQTVYDEVPLCGPKQANTRLRRCRWRHIPLIGGASCRQCTRSSKRDRETKPTSRGASLRTSRSTAADDPSRWDRSQRWRPRCSWAIQHDSDSKALASYVGMIPREYSSGGRQRLGGLSKQGNPLLRFLWGEAGAHASRKDPSCSVFTVAK